jgi:alpha-L-arabinofuranosidase
METVAVHDQAGEALTIFAVNRNLTEPMDMAALGKLDGARLDVTLPPASWNVIRMGKRRVE